MNQIDCLRCRTKMQYVSSEKIQLGQTGWMLGNLPNLLAGAMEVDVYSCPVCGKLEFFQSENVEDDLPQRQCPKCGKMHDFDYPKCPFCKYDYSR
ncbi:hypothetical protein CE91St43_22170 [Oscillospiraceae bacterium]|nr:hypothetical protein CE91St43_22170 [Oscillospiraceae bacterium]